MKIEAKHIQGILDRAGITITAIRNPDRTQLPGIHIPEIPGFIANAINEDRRIFTDIAALKMRQKIAYNEWTAASKILSEEYEAIAADVDQEISKRVAECNHNSRIETSGEEFAKCGVRLEVSVVLTCGICGCILDKEMW